MDTGRNKEDIYLEIIMEEAVEVQGKIALLRR
jgi:hypothetical protein